MYFIYKYIYFIAQMWAITLLGYVRLLRTFFFPVYSYFSIPILIFLGVTHLCKESFWLTLNEFGLKLIHNKSIYIYLDKSRVFVNVEKEVNKFKS